MKKYKLFIWIGVYILTVLFCIGYHYFDNYMLNKNCYSHITILKSTTDYRHLTSIVYIDLKGDTVALDYLTYTELINHI